MELERRLLYTLATALLCALSLSAAAQSWPSRSVRTIKAANLRID